MQAGRLVAALVAVVAVGVPAPAASASAAGAPAVRVEPSTDLVHGQMLRVSGRGFTPGSSIAVVECDRRATDQSGCDLGTVVFDSAGDAGTFVTRFEADRVLQTEQFGDVDCASAPDACYLVAANSANTGERAVHPLSFDPSAPLPHPLRVKVAVRLVGLLRDGRAVLHGTVTCNRPGDAVISVTLLQQATPEDVRAFGESRVACGPDEVRWRVAAAEVGGPLRPRHAVADVAAFAFAGGEDFAEDHEVARVELRR